VSVCHKPTRNLPFRVWDKVPYIRDDIRTSFKRAVGQANGSTTIVQQEGLAVASIARDDPSPLPGMHRDHNALYDRPMEAGVRKQA